MMKQSISSIRSNLDGWEKGRYITKLNTTVKGIEMVKYEVGLRTFMEIGYKNITKFICTVGEIVMEGGNRSTTDWIGEMITRL